MERVVCGCDPKMTLSLEQRVHRTRSLQGVVIGSGITAGLSLIALGVLVYKQKHTAFVVLTGTLGIGASIATTLAGWSWRREAKEIARRVEGLSKRKVGSPKEEATSREWVEHYRPDLIPKQGAPNWDQLRIEAAGAKIKIWHSGCLVSKKIFAESTDRVSELQQKVSEKFGAPVVLVAGDKILPLEAPVLALYKLNHLKGLAAIKV